MEKSLFAKFALFFTAIIADIQERVNGSKMPQSYLHKEMLTPEMSTDLQWKSLSIDGSIVTADVVSMDSALPLKRRDSFGQASGEIPKLGMKISLNEKTMSEIDVLVARNVETKVLVEKIFSDASKCLLGIYEKYEFMFLQALSTGVCLVDDDTNVGTGIRVDFGYKAGNSFGVELPWSNTASKPLDDIARVVKLSKSKGDRLSIVMMDDATFQNLAATTQVKERYAFALGFVGTQIQIPNLEQVNQMFAKNYGLQIKIVDRTVVTERDGVRTTVSPWGENKVIFLQSMKVGKLVYGILAEDTRRNPAVMYEKADGYILMKKWHSPEPFAEFTSSQALGLPVINNVDSIYVINAEEATLDVQTEGDANFLYKTVLYTKASVASALLLANPDTKLTVASTDAKLLAEINKLSDEAVLVFEANITAV